MDMQLEQMTRDEMLAALAADEQAFFDKFFEELGIQPKDVSRDFSFYSVPDDSFLRNPDINGFTLKGVAKEGGYEGGGEHAERTYALIEKSNPDVLLAHCEQQGFYTSYDGTEWSDDGPYVVYPRQVVVTQYHTSKEVK